VYIRSKKDQRPHQTPEPEKITPTKTPAVSQNVKRKNFSGGAGPKDHLVGEHSAYDEDELVVAEPGVHLGTILFWCAPGSLGLGSKTVLKQKKEKALSTF
jgi:hypothetical protein